MAKYRAGMKVVKSNRCQGYDRLGPMRPRKENSKKERSLLPTDDKSWRQVSSSWDTVSCAMSRRNSSERIGEERRRGRKGWKERRSKSVDWNRRKKS